MSFGEAQRFGVLVASGGATWEGDLVEALTAAGPGVVLLRRCLDVAELLAAAATGAARVAVVSHHLPGLDADAVTRLQQHGVRVLAIGAGRAADQTRLERIGVSAVLPRLDDTFTATVRALATSTVPVAPVDEAEAPVVDAPSATAGRTVAVWGPHGAPGRTTVAVGLAAALAQLGRPTLLLDLDPYGGVVAQHLGVTEEVSGLLAAARAANTGVLDPRRLAGFARGLGPGLRVLTGLPRPDRWRELRPAGVEELVGQAALLEQVVVVDAGPGLESEDEHVLTRDALVTATVTSADVVVAVAAADPVGLARAARALADLEEVRPGGAAYVVVNRWRAGLGWSREEVREMVLRVAPAAEVVLLPEDRMATDRALLSGRALAECRDSALSKALAGLAERLAGEGIEAPPRRRRALLRR